GSAVHLGRARSAFSRLAVPADGEIVGLLRLNLVHGVEHDHAFRHIGVVVFERAALRIAPPDPERRRRRRRSHSALPPHTLACLSPKLVRFPPERRGKGSRSTTY